MASVQPRYAIEQMIEAIANTDIAIATKCVSKAREEYAVLAQVDSVCRYKGECLKTLNEFIGDVSNGHIKKAKPRCQKLKESFNNHLKGYLKKGYDRKYEDEKEVKDLPNGKPGQTETKIRNSRVQRQEKSSNSDKQSGRVELPKQTDKSFVKNSENRMHVPGSRVTELEPRSTEQHQIERRRTVQTDNDLQRTKESRRASLAMRQNNPDIADLSDTNRPTKIAERFSELYDNEWTEAFEELSKDFFSEEETIKHLLSIVEDAYKHCTNVAEQQIKQLAKVFKRILILGPYYYDNEPSSPPDFKEHEADDTSSLVLFRKGVASEALPGLEKAFVEKLNKWKSDCNLSKQLDAVHSYVKKAVELTWWMCVQDPPVHMVIQKDKFDPILYKAYTKSGSVPDYFVWPALRLHEHGCVLQKGVVQYK